MPASLGIGEQGLAGTVQVNEVRISLDDQGRGVPILLLHGFPATRFLWSRVAPQLVEAGYRVIVPDLVGYGESEAPVGVRIDMASQASWMLALLDKLSLPRVVVVAHDVGTAAAQLLVAGSPARVRGLALLDGVYADDWAMEAISSIQAWDPANAHRLFAVLKRRLAKSDVLLEMLTAYEGESGGLRLIRAARDLDPRQTVDTLDRLRATGVPITVLWGERDEYLSIDRIGQRLAQALSVALVKLPGAHFTPLDCPGEVVARLREFLGSLGREESVQSSAENHPR